MISMHCPVLRYDVRALGRHIMIFGLDCGMYSYSNDT